MFEIFWSPHFFGDGCQKTSIFGHFGVDQSKLKSHNSKMGWPRKKIFCMRIAMNHINVHTKFQVRSSMYMVEHQLWLHLNGPKYAISGLLSGLKSSRNEPNWSKTKFFDDRAHKSVGLVVGSRKGVGRINSINHIFLLVQGRIFDSYAEP